MDSVDATPQPRRVIYKKPPIIERAASVTAKISEEVFHQRFEGWKAIVRKEFPDYDPIQQWLLNFKQDGEVPTLEDAPARVLVTHRFWKRNAENKRFMSMRILPNRLTINLHPEKGDPHHFEELRESLMRWLPQWSSHFGTTEFTIVQLDYINLIAVETTPQFVDGKTGAVLIGEALEVFSGVPGRHQGLIAPYDCEIGIVIDKTRPSVLRMHVHGLEFRPVLGGGVRVDFQAVSDRNARPLTAPEVASETEFLHDAVIEKFDTVFTAKAKASFEPK